MNHSLYLFPANPINLVPRKSTKIKHMYVQSDKDVFQFFFVMQ